MICPAFFFYRAGTDRTGTISTVHTGTCTWRDAGMRPRHLVSDGSPTLWQLLLAHGCGPRYDMGPPEGLNL